MIGVDGATRVRVAVLRLVVALACAPAASAQSASASSDSFVLATSIVADGRRLASASFVLDAAVGRADASRGASTAFVLAGGFGATLGATATGRPWLLATRPLEATMRSLAPLVMSGTELDLGAVPMVTIGGVAAAVGSRSRSAITTTLPHQPRPGRHAVVVANALGTTTLTAGIAVLPLLEVERPPRPDEAFAVRYRGRAGDRFALAVGLSRTPLLRIDPLLHGLEIAPLIVTDLFAVSDASGMFDVAIPAVPVLTGILLQAVVLSADPGYAPGTFTNSLELR